jgi:hypothetical protein
LMWITEGLSSLRTMRASAFGCIGISFENVIPKVRNVHKCTLEVARYAGLASLDKSGRTNR